jgi:hypothetical protein
MKFFFYIWDITYNLELIWATEKYISVQLNCKLIK